MSINKPKNISIAYWVTFASLIVLTTLSMVAYKERTLFVDSSWFINNMLNSDTFYFMEMRYGAFITQLGVIAAAKMNMPLQSILFIFSVSFYLFYLAVVLILGLRWRQKQLAILMCFYLILFISDGYFCTVGEIFQGLSWMFLFLGMYFQTRFKHSLFSHIAMVLFAFLGLICHMIVLFPFAFLWLYLNLEKQSLQQVIKDKKFWTYSTVLLALAFLRYYVSTSGWYDAAKLAPVHEMSLSSVLNAFRSGHAKIFFGLMLSNYWISIPIILVGVVTLLQSRKFLQLGLVGLFSLVYFVLVCIVYPDRYDRNMLFYFENEWAPLAVILCTPFVLQFFDIVKSKAIVLPVFSIIVLVRLFYIFDAYQFYHHRLKNLETLTDALHEKQINKAIIVSDKVTSDAHFVMDWSLPTESILLSTIKGYQPAITFKVVDANFEFRQLSDSFYSNFNIVPISELNKRYFVVDNVQDYHIFNGLDSFNLKDNLSNYK